MRELLDVTRLFGEGNKLNRRHQPALGMLPAQQCFDRDHARGGDVNFGLEKQPQFVVLYRTPRAREMREMSGLAFCPHPHS